MSASDVRPMPVMQDRCHTHASHARPMSYPCQSCENDVIPMPVMRDRCQDHCQTTVKRTSDQCPLLCIPRQTHVISSPHQRLQVACHHAPICFRHLLVAGDTEAATGATCISPCRNFSIDATSALHCQSPALHCQSPASHSPSLETCMPYTPPRIARVWRHVTLAQMGHATGWDRCSPATGPVQGQRQRQGYNRIMIGYYPSCHGMAWQVLNLTPSSIRSNLAAAGVPDQCKLEPLL